MSSVKGVPVTPDVANHVQRGGDRRAERLLDDRKRTSADAKRRIKKHLSPFFGKPRMITITASDLRAYVAKRQKDRTSVRQKHGGNKKGRGDFRSPQGKTSGVAS